MQALHGITYTIEDVIAEDYKVVNGTFTGTHRRYSRPDGKQVKFSIIQVDQLADGKIVEHRTIGDSLTILQQLCGKI